MTNRRTCLFPFVTSALENRFTRFSLLKGSARKAGEHFQSLPTGGEAEPSPPWHKCLGCAFTQPPPTLLRYGAGLARQTFVPRLCLRQRARLLRTAPQNLVSPARWCSSPRPRGRQLPHQRSPSTRCAPSIPRHDRPRVACGFLLKSIDGLEGINSRQKLSPDGDVLRGFPGNGLR